MLKGKSHRISLQRNAINHWCYTSCLLTVLNNTTCMRSFEVEPKLTFTISNDYLIHGISAIFLGYQLLSGV